MLKINKKLNNIDLSRKFLNFFLEQKKLFIISQQTFKVILELIVKVLNLFQMHYYSIIH